MEYLIRDFRPADLHRLMDLIAKHAAYERHEFDGTGKAELLKSALLSVSPRLHCWMIEAGGQLVGYSTFTFDFSTWHARQFLHMDCLYLEERWRGFGIGKAILKKLLQVASEKNCVEVQWQTPEFNDRAIRFYERLGAKGSSKRRFSLSSAVD
jgi:GNAT superfamily N-acetyltransferase